MERWDPSVLKAPSGKKKFSTTTVLCLRLNFSMIMTVCVSPSVTPIPIPKSLKTFLKRKLN